MNTGQAREEPCNGSATRQAFRFATGPLRAFIPCLALLIFGATFRAGIARNMDQMVGQEAWGRVATAIVIVFTGQKYGVGGYAVSNCLFTELLSRGFTDDRGVVEKLGAKAPDHFASGAYLDGVLQAMWRDLPRTPDCGAGFRGFGADDLGFADFARVAFWTFGVQIRSFYYLFFLLYGTSLLISLLERRHDPVGQGILTSVAALIYATCFYSDLFSPQPPGLGNMLNPRFMPVIGLLPLVHVLLITVERARATAVRFTIVVLQSTLVFLAVHIRATGAWLLGALAIAMLVTILVDLARPGPALADIPGLVLRRWPAIVALGVVFLGVQSVSVSLHPVYRREGWLQHHAFWHSVYYSLQIHPRYRQRFDKMHDGASGDEMPVAAAQAYLRAHPGEDSPDYHYEGGGLKYAPMEEFIRRAFFDFVWQHPRYVFETFAIVKSRAIWLTVRSETLLTWRSAPLAYRLLLVVGLLALGSVAALDGAAFGRLRLLTSIVALAAMASLLVPYLTLPGAPFMSEMIMALQLAAMLLVALGIAAAVRIARSRIVSADGSANPLAHPT